MHFQKVEAHTSSDLRISQSSLASSRNKVLRYLGALQNLEFNQQSDLDSSISRVGKKIALHLLGHMAVRDINVRISFMFGIKLNYLIIMALKHELFKHIFFVSYSREDIFCKFLSIRRDSLSFYIFVFIYLQNLHLL